jgi:hypothetical protein
MVAAMSASEGLGWGRVRWGSVLGLCGPVARPWAVACAPVAWA